MFAFAILSFLLVLPWLSAAQLVPTGPAPDNVFKQGSPCTISWTADASGKWKSTFIELMTGPNTPMVHLATVANVDGTDPTKTSFSFPCPSVSPNAAIYFYQFTAQDQNTTWTGRFAISDANGATSSPPNPNQPDGSPIPWGTGKILNSPQASPPPPTAPSGQVDGSGAGTPGAASSGPASILTASAPSNSTAPAPATSSAASVPASSAVSSSASGFSTVPVVLPTTSALGTALPSSSAAVPTASSSNAIAPIISSPAAFIAATLLGLLSLY